MAEAGLFRRLDTVLLRVHDVDAAKAWYRAKLELVPAFEDATERLVVFGLGGGASLSLWELKRGESLPVSPGLVTTFPIFAVDDARHTWHVLRERDVLVDPVVEAGGVLSFEFRDLDGNRLEVCQVA